MNADAAKLDAAMRARFSGGGGPGGPGGPGAARDDAFGGADCGDCGVPMALYKRGARGSPVLRCDVCDAWWPLPDRPDTTYAPGAATCGTCGFQEVVSTSGGGAGGPWEKTLCPKCHERHPAAARPVATCAYCGKRLLLTKTRAGRFLVACDKECGHAVWLPSCALSAELSEARCSGCSAPGNDVRKVALRLRGSKVPPGTDLEPVVCVLCDASLRDVGLDRRRPANAAGRGKGGRGRGAPARGKGRGGPKRPRAG